ncbi:peptidase inhibitor family I36 protein [Amycolatopsis magusensis]|uniref:Peptidase inhibitor family I36 n=1 Tax=Amycolatopsis magusensis TaxID=882444 RepID=A0ABS4PUB0_9PSEU|nr:peptidase inhibitor family I36 protein [Amycolatopsis magusensis]MBP2182423.1 hypothetical protein [Amycolatopsis magusensis]MDI5977275.1 peptidase inhibitor family I36 protein [Amycolatopsis magusensis]
MIAAFFGLLLTLSGMAPATAETAGMSQANVLNGVCDVGELCLYRDENFGGPFTEKFCNQPTCTVVNFRFFTFNDGSNTDNQVTSFWNRTHQWGTLFQETGAQPGQCCFYTIQPSGRGGDRLAHVGREFNDSFSSLLTSNP